MKKLKTMTLSEFEKRYRKDNTDWKFDFTAIKSALEKVEGRMTSIDEGQNFSVIVDYAHTPDSFEKLFKDLKDGSHT